MNGRLAYRVKERGRRLRNMSLTVFSDSDRMEGTLAEIRRVRLARLVEEASRQGCGLTYSDLSVIMLASRATLKRDVACLRKMGMDVPMGRGGTRECQV